MKKVCVITGGGSGIGLATAKILGKENHIIIVGRTVKKLESALKELETEGIEAEAFACDISDRTSVDKLAEHAKEVGTVSSVIHAAGMSPHMGEARTIMEANAIGTINMNEAFYNVMEEGSCIIDVSSMSAYLTPKIIMPVSGYKYSRIDKEIFMKKMMARVNLFPKKQRSGVAYSISKNFVIWYAKTDAAKFGQKGIRVLSITPGSFKTPMAELEKEDTDGFIEHCAIKRYGDVEEIANLLAFCVSDKASYLTGTDILCDGGCVASGVNPLKMK
ncbi:SDR family oxidoreductase [Clostridium sp. YIM B02505]|uniref:SDR family oxidoreductase n=1 Tax=Clostridium yunnanense TaxID=2800325 RepID=A0ABS1ES96_9CLOT|nr:SDR family oxidoreductase [Clostridium yunnanense]MBK1812281.1 SDR family oxidoreductase [Clostridium yunnanense]